MTQGELVVVDHKGKRRTYGNGGEPRSVIRLTDARTEWALAVNPELALGEAYMDGRLVIEEGDLYTLLDLLIMNAEANRRYGYRWMASPVHRLGRRLHQFNPASRARRNAQHHYDLGDELYELFLDSDWQYSCAYFGSPEADLESAQYRKKVHLAAKLRLEAGQKVLDIGCGWGGLGLFLAERFGSEVTGLTLAQHQHDVANARAREAGLERSARFHLRDYRHEADRYDRIVSVGMFEHVGVNHYDVYFEKIRELLSDDGVAVIHSIGRCDVPGYTNPWMRKYIFPGSYIPALSEVLPAVERAGLWVTDIEILRLHYAQTLAAWRQRFMARREEAKALHDERFCRMWEFYLVGAEMLFRRQGGMVFQLQLAKQVDTLPITRDYMVEDERAILEEPAGDESSVAAS